MYIEPHKTRPIQSFVQASHQSKINFFGTTKTHLNRKMNQPKEKWLPNTKYYNPLMRWSGKPLDQVHRWIETNWTKWELTGPLLPITVLWCNAGWQIRTIPLMYAKQERKQATLSWLHRNLPTVFAQCYMISEPHRFTGLGQKRLLQIHTTTVTSGNPRNFTPTIPKHNNIVIIVPHAEIVRN